MRRDISADSKATHYCKYCGLTMQPDDVIEHPWCDGDLCEPMERGSGNEVAKRVPVTTYQSRYEGVQRAIQTPEDALKKAQECVPSLKGASVTNLADVQAALVTLARKVLELEYEWS